MPAISAAPIDLAQSLHRCSPETLAAAERYRANGDRSAIPAIVMGVIARYQPTTAAVPLAQAAEDARLVEDLGLDSLTLLEIMMTIEEVLVIRIANEDLREISTLMDLHGFLDRTISGETSAPSPKASGKKLTREHILLTLPQQPPFLFVDEAEIAGETIRASYKIRGDEYFLQGHFKGDPVFPASVVFEAMGQVACLWLLENNSAGFDVANIARQVVFASLEGAHFYRKARPGDKLEFTQTLVKLREPLAIFDGQVFSVGQRVASIERLTLAFGEKPTSKIEHPAT